MNSLGIYTSYQDFGWLVFLDDLFKSYGNSNLLD